MIVEPKVRGFMCTTAHPEGCKAAVREQIDYINSMPKTDGPKKVLVIGASMGYGLASRIALTYSCDADTIGVIFDKAGKEKRTEQPDGTIPLHLRSLPQKTVIMQRR